MNIKILLISSIFILPVVGAELNVDDSDDSKDDVDRKVSTSKIVSHGIQFLAQDSLIGELYLPNTDDQVKNIINNYFKNAPTYAVGLGTIGMAVRSVRNPDVLFFDEQGKAFKLTHDSKSFPLHCALNEKLTFLGDQIPHVTVLYNNGDLVQFKRKGVFEYKWPSRLITKITDKYRHQGEEEPSALEDNPSAIEQLTTFDDGECMCYSSKKIFVISEDGQELCRYIMRDQLSITDVVSTFPKLRKIALCIMQTPTPHIEEQPELHTWTRATKFEHWRNNRITGSWYWERITHRPTYLDFNNKNDLVDHSTGDTLQ